MKQRLLLALAGIALLTAQPIRAKDSPVSDQPVTVECQMVILPVRTMLELVPKFASPTETAAAWARLQGLIAADPKILSASLMVHTVLEKKASTESVQAFRYATEYQPPQVPSTDAAALQSMDKVLEALKHWPHVGITPTAFESRHLGPTMTVEVQRPVLPRQYLVEYELAHIRFDRFAKIEAGRLADGQQIFVEQPYFSTMRDVATAVLLPDRPRLVGTHRLTGEEGLFELFFLTLHTVGDVP